MGKIFYIMGKSASGKDSLYQALRADQTLGLKGVTMYTTRPRRVGEEDGREYFFTDESGIARAREQKKLIEIRTYQTVHGPWSYFTQDDGQIDLTKDSYLMVGVLESYRSMRVYYGAEHVIPLYIEVEDGERLMRAITRERQQKSPRYAELCRRFLADAADFSEDRLAEAGIRRRFQNVNFEVQKGDRVGILGLNGAGKSTLLKVIAGVFKPTEGKVIKNGRLVPLLELGAGFDPQYTGRENIYLYGAMLGYSKSFIEEKFDEIVEFSELKEFIDVPIKNYSSGMKARLGFSIATLVSPDILILDEVLSVGDAKFRKKSEKKVLSMFDKGVTVLFVSHSLEQVRRLCNKAMILEKGQLIAYGDIDEISEKYSRMIS